MASTPRASHPLADKWAVWVQKKGVPRREGATSWFDGTVCVGTCSEVETFWPVRLRARGRGAGLLEPFTGSAASPAPCAHVTHSAPPPRSSFPTSRALRASLVART